MNRKLFNCSLVLLAACLFSALFQIRKLLTGARIDSDLTPALIGLGIQIVLLYVPGRDWRLGMLFIVAYNVARYLSATTSTQSFTTAIVLNGLSITLLFPAFLYFLKLKREEPKQGLP